MVKSLLGLILPGNRPTKEEALLLTRDNLIDHNVMKNLESHSFSENFTKTKTRGIRKLRKWQSKGEIVIRLTDKSGKICISPLEVYEWCGD